MNVSDIECELEQCKRDAYVIGRRMRYLTEQLRKSVPIKPIRETFKKMEERYGKPYSGYRETDMVHYDIFVGSGAEDVNDNVVCKLYLRTGIPITVVERIAKKYKCNIDIYHSEDCSGGSGMGSETKKHYIKTIYYRNIPERIPRRNDTPDIESVRKEIQSKCRETRKVICKYYVTDSNNVDTEICQTNYVINGKEAYSIGNMFGVDIKVVSEYTSGYLSNKKNIEVYEFTGDDEI